MLTLFFCAGPVTDYAQAKTADTARFGSFFRSAASPGSMIAMNEILRDTDVRGILHTIQVPTLVLHGKDDQCVPFAEGQAIAAGIPGAEFVQLDSRNHILLEHEPAWQRFCEAVLAFLQPGGTPNESAFAALSARERQVLLREAIARRSFRPPRRMP